MEDSSRMPLEHRRSGDRGGLHRFFRFDSTVSMGTIIQVASILLGFGVAYGTYREDRATMKADIELVKLTADRDRADVKAAVTDFRSDLKDMKGDLRSVDTSLAVLKAQALVTPQPAKR
jgi:hypothetical protein